MEYPARPRGLGPQRTSRTPARRHEEPFPAPVALTRCLVCPLVCVTVLAASARALGSGDDEIVTEFKKYFRTYKDAPTRVEAVLSLDGHESVETVDALVPVLKLQEPDVVRASVRVLSKFKTQPPIRRPPDPEHRRGGALGLLQAIAEGSTAARRSR